MKFTYPAIFRKTENGRYKGYFPDLAMCEAEGADLDDAIRSAIEAEGDWIRLELEEENPELPPISDIHSLTLAEGEFVRNIGVNIRFYEGWDE
ncbi:MAG: type II toxin-antitoxin system HicB family antitoxin [bacterium]